MNLHAKIAHIISRVYVLLRKSRKSTKKHEPVVHANMTDCM